MKKNERLKRGHIVIAILVLILILIANVKIRTVNIPQLKDITTGHYTLAPDLDPFLFLRLAKEIVSVGLQNPDMMRMAPLGTVNYAKGSLMPWAIVAIYRLVDFFNGSAVTSMEFAAIITPVIFSCLATIFFFLFSFKLFSLLLKNDKAALVSALIAAALYIVLPPMLHRAVAGVPEIESFGMVWYWLAFFFFLNAWQQQATKKIILNSCLAGIFTGLMVWTWGGYRYIFMTIALTSLLVFLFRCEPRKNKMIFSCWAVLALLLSLAKIISTQGSVKTLLTSIADTGITTLVLFIFLIDFALMRIRKVNKIKIPKEMLSIIIAFILALIFGTAIFGFSFVLNTVKTVFERLAYPFGRGRVGLTVAENMQPYLNNWLSTFEPLASTKLIANAGGILKNPIAWFVLWSFIIALCIIFYEAAKHFDKAEKKAMVGLFVIFLFGFLFSRISSGSVLNGDNMLSKFVYYSSLFIFVIYLIGIYIWSHRNNKETYENFKKIRAEHTFLLVFMFWMIVSMRGAIRLFFIIAPSVALMLAFLPAKIWLVMQKAKNKEKRMLWLAALIFVLFIGAITFIQYEKSTFAQAKATIPTSYDQQWQKAMAWVRENTPEGSIFVHWWDYGYWVQTLGHRPTVTDGGHANGFWDHITARYLLTAQHERTALQLCKAHNVSYLLIDSTDIGKYTAFASIGSDASGKDRFSWISTFVLDERQTYETKNETLMLYRGSTLFDEETVLHSIIMPERNPQAGIAGFILALDNNSSTIKKVEAIVTYKGQQFRVPVRYVWLNGKKYDFKTSENEEMLEGMLYIIPKATDTGINPIGAAMYLSRKALATEWVRLYLLNETQNFELVHAEPHPYIEYLNKTFGFKTEFLYVNGNTLGPIKIWKVHYPDDIPYYEEYLKVGSFRWAELDYLGT